MEAVGRRLYQLRIEKGVTQTELVRRSGIPQPNLSNIEKGKQDFTVSTLVRICSALGVNPAEVFTEEAPAPPFAFSRAGAERMARALAGGAPELPRAEKEIVGLARDLLPGSRKRPLSTKKIQNRWLELRKRLTAEEIRVLLERVEDAKARRKSQEEKDYQALLQSIKKVFKKQ